ncbi:MAG: YqhA family protein [bacterium]
MIQKLDSFFRELCKKILKFNIFFILFGVLGLAISSLLTFLMAFYHMYELGIMGYEKIFLHGHPHFNAHICAILETTLIGVILFVCAIGLYMLFWKDINVPDWLKISTVDELKERLVGIIITVLAVLFLEHVFSWKAGWELCHTQGLLMISVSIALVIIVLIFYIKVLISAIHHH